MAADLFGRHALAEESSASQVEPRRILASGDLIFDLAEYGAGQDSPRYEFIDGLVGPTRNDRPPEPPTQAVQLVDGRRVDVHEIGIKRCHGSWCLGRPRRRELASLHAPSRDRVLALPLSSPGQEFLNEGLTL